MQDYIFDNNKAMYLFSNQYLYIIMARFYVVLYEVYACILRGREKKKKTEKH